MGAIFSTDAQRPAAALPHPYDPQETPLSPKQKLLLYPLYPLLFVFAIFRLFVFIASVVAAAIVCSLCMIGQPKDFQPIHGWRRHVVRFGMYLCGRVILLTFGVWPFMLSVSGEWDKTTPVIVAAPHVGMTDAFLFFVLDFPRPVILEPYSKLPLVRQILQAGGALLVPIASASTSKAATKDDGDKPKGGTQTNAVRETILEHKRTFVPGDDVTPIALFSEGITHAGTALLPFFPGAFEGGSAVQPVVVHYEHKYYNGHAFLSDLGTHFARLFMGPWLRITVDFLPAHHPTAEEAASGVIMSEAVRRKMSEASDYPMHTLGARELRKEFKAEAERAQATKGGPSDAAKVLV